MISSPAQGGAVCAVTVDEDFVKGMDREYPTMLLPAVFFYLESQGDMLHILQYSFYSFAHHRVWVCGRPSMGAR